MLQSLMFGFRLLGSIVPLLFLLSCSRPLICPPEGFGPRPVVSAKRGYGFSTDVLPENRSAFLPLENPVDAYAARLWLVDHAAESLDVQYYIFKDDRIGNDFLYHLLQAANRGVQVRLLLDDLTTTDKDTDWAMVSCHPCIELKIFNPNPWRRFLRNVALVLNIETLGKRMHNKALVADGRTAIVGGRNIGDEYYLPESPVMFIDADILAVGAVVPEISEAFEIYWRSEESIKAEKILDGAFTPESFTRTLRNFRQINEIFEASGAFETIERSTFMDAARRGTLKFTLADRAWFYYDLPQKVSTSKRDNETHLSSRIREDIEKTRESLILVSPYFIPSGPMLERLKAARERNVDITVVTNSLASTDVAVVYSGYRKYIEPLLKMGVKLYEVKPMQFEKKGLKRRERRQRRMSLHTKLIVIDDDRLIMGSANIDPRSVKLNTEYLLEITSKPLATEVRKSLKKVMDLDHLYRLAWEKYPQWAANGDDDFYGPVWITREKNETVRYYRPPGVGFFKRLGIGLFGLLPLEGQL
ncbi:phospholipase D-like domain-containing protein [Hydrogenimonas sp.]